MNLVNASISIFPFVDFYLISILISPAVSLMSSSIFINPSMKLMNNSILISVLFSLVFLSIISPNSSILSWILIIRFIFDFNCLWYQTIFFIRLKAFRNLCRFLDSFVIWRKRIWINLIVVLWWTLCFRSILRFFRLRNWVVTYNTMGTNNWHKKDETYKCFHHLFLNIIIEKEFDVISFRINKSSFVIIIIISKVFLFNISWMQK